MQIDDILNHLHQGTNALVPDSWAQGRTLFGGLTGAILCQAACMATNPERRLRNLEVGFCRPFEAMKPWSVELETLADGKTVTIQSVRIVQEEKIRATARADFVLPLESEVEIDTFQPPELSPPSSSVRLQGDQLPRAYQTHFEGYISTRGMPFAGQAVPEIGGWVRFLQTPERISEAHLVCLIDAWPPTAAPHFKGFKPLSTISWGVHFAHPLTDMAPGDFLGYHSRVDFGEDGISSSHAEVWSPRGQLLAKSFQTNIIYG